ncbi:50S ribosomal protein L24 [Haloplasma contractile]|uniref:Large ribosomal subunit protein uL24 n=1 Tax=Haloplasma contractile SSD-17B TaxID=1033810 RepID=U2DVG9_9MOLU|nr:50S ribosomal protein L24 [Haloplasma contractile]ERJ12377.1 50S ribosomal protein L24 [Haloplasma contractile SSD-17B]
MHVKKGDKVQVISGKYKGKQGVVQQVLRKQNKVVVEGINTVKKHTKPSQMNPDGGIVEFEAPIANSNVMPIDPKTNQPVRVGYKFVEDKKGNQVKVRYSKGKNASGEILDDPNNPAY